MLRFFNIILAFILSIFSIQNSLFYNHSDQLNEYDTTENNEITYQTYTEIIDNEKKPEITKVTVSAECRGNIERKVTVDDMYNIDYLVSGTVGLIGAPIEIYTDSSLEKTELNIYYDESQLRQIPEKNIIVLFYDKNSDVQIFDEITAFTADNENNIINIPSPENGTYMLVDAYEWYSAWGKDASGYAYEKNPLSYDSDWERECYAGDIMKIADKEWAMENAPVFKVSNENQLAGVVYYINAVSGQDNYDRESIQITLENDIDLGSYEWVPMGWNTSSDHGFNGILNGNGHTIKNLRINTPDQSYVGLIGFSTGCEVTNLKIENAEISGNNYVGIVGGYVLGNSVWSGIDVSGNVTASSHYGSVAGYEVNLYFENCKTDTIINGKKYDYFSSSKDDLKEAAATEVFKLTLNEDKSITRDEHSGYNSLGWEIYSGELLVLHRNAENELTLPAEYASFGGGLKHRVYLSAFIDGEYIRVSNIIEF